MHRRLSSLKPPAGEATPLTNSTRASLTFTLLPVGGVKGRYLLTGRFKPRLQSGMLHTCADGTDRVKTPRGHWRDSCISALIGCPTLDNFVLNLNLTRPVPMRPKMSLQHCYIKNSKQHMIVYSIKLAHITHVHADMVDCNDFTIALHFEPKHKVRPLTNHLYD